MINTQNIAELSEKVAALEAAIKNAGIELPTVTTDDNGKTLQVVAGKWDKGMIIPELPAVTSDDNGKALIVSSGAWSANNIPAEIKSGTLEVTLDSNGECITNITNQTFISGYVRGASTLAFGRKTSNGTLVISLVNNRTMEVYKNETATIEYLYY